MYYPKTQYAGKLIGNWRIVGVSDLKHERNYKWLGVCIECGEELFAVIKYFLRSGKGCMTCYQNSRIEKAKTNLEPCLRLAWWKFNYHSKLAKHAVEISEEEFRSLILGNCHYCGSEPRSRLSTGKNGKYLVGKRNGIDRIDSSKGYLASNVVACCRQCNMAKSDLTQVQFFDLVKRIHDRHCLSLDGALT